MSTLHLPTLLIANIGIALLVSIMLYGQQRILPEDIRGGHEWLAATLAGAVAMLLYVAPIEWVLINTVVPNFLLPVNAYLYYLGSCRFFGRPPVVRGLLPLFGGLVVSLLWYSFVEPHFGMRVTLLSAGMSLISLLQMVTLYRYGGRSFGNGVLLTTTALITLVTLWRMAWGIGLTADPASQWLQSVNLIYALSYALCFIAMAQGYVLISSERVRDRLQHEATHDPLTGVLNRRAFLDIAARELERSRRSGEPLAILAVDLDRFKKINDTYGHSVGDKVLIDFVGRVGAQLRSADRLSRFGGEEFMLILPNTPLTGAIEVAERIRDALGQHADLPTYTASTGIAMAEPVLNLESILKRTDEALYRAKAAGRNRIEVAGAAESVAASERPAAV